MRLSRHRSLYSPPEAWDTTWEELAASILAPPPVLADKLAGQVWSPCERLPDAPTNDEVYCLRLHCAVVDYDTDAARALPSAIATIQARGLEALVHSSHSATPENPKFRLILPLLIPITTGDWKRKWHAIADHFPGLDKNCKDAGHRYFLPACGPSGPAFAAARFRGRALDPATDLVGAGPSKAKRRIVLEDLKHLAKQWSRARSLERVAMGRMLTALCEGRPFADRDRDTACYRLTSDIMTAIPDGDPETLVPFFGPSLSLMAGDHPPPPPEKILDQAQRAAERAAIDMPQADPTSDPMILVTPAGSTYYTRNGVGWKGPWQGDAVAQSIHEDLGTSGRIQLYAMGPNGPRKKGRPEILETYGRRIAEHRIVLGAPHSEFLPEAGIFREAAAAPNPHLGPPEFSMIVDGYLRSLAGEERHYHALNGWLSLLPDLRRPLAAMVLFGAAGAGKSLFAEACARLWSEEGPTAEVEASGTWTGSILRCPLVFADEAISADTKKIRYMIQSRSTLITRKYLPNIQAEGCIRMVIAANADHVLHFGEDLDAMDLQAFYERLYLVRVTEQAREYAAIHGRAIKAGLARHALWLAAHYPKPTARFGVEGPTDDLARIATRGGIRSDLCRFVVEFLKSPVRIPGQAMQLYQPLGPDGLPSAPAAIGISLAETLQQWERYIPGGKAPKVQALRQAASSLGYYRVTQRARLWCIPIRTIQDWVDDVGWDAIDVAKAAVEFFCAPSKFTLVKTAMAN